MSAKGYTTEEKIESYLGDITIIGDAAENYILATEKFIDNFTGRNFIADENASSRLYNGNNRQGLIIDDCIEVAKVEVGSNYYGDSFSEIQAGGADGYYLMPPNYSSDSLPIRKIGLRSRIWIEGHANHKITAKWGYSVAVPNDISQAATIIASGMYYANRGENTGAIKSEKIGEYQVQYADTKGKSDYEWAIGVLESYKKYEL